MWKWFTRKLSQTQGLGSEISRLLGLFPAFFLTLKPQEKVAAEFENHGEVSVEQSKYLGGESLSNSKNCFSSCCLLQDLPPPPKKRQCSLDSSYILRRISCSSFLKLAIFSPPFPFGVDFFEVTWNIRIW